MMPRLRRLGFRRDAKRAATREMPHRVVISLSAWRRRGVGRHAVTPPRTDVDALDVLIVAGFSRIGAAHPLSRGALPVRHAHARLSLATLDQCPSDRLRARDGAGDAAR